MFVRKIKINQNFVSRFLLGVGCAGSLFMSEAYAFNYSFSSALSASNTNNVSVSEGLACANCVTPGGQLNDSNLKFATKHIGLEGAKATLFAMQFESNAKHANSSSASRHVRQKKNYGLLPPSLKYLQDNLGMNPLLRSYVSSEHLSSVNNRNLGLGFQMSDSVSYGVHISRSTQIAYTTSEFARMNSLIPNQSSLLAAPVERTTNNAVLSMLYNTSKMRSKITYQTSSFWDNSMSSAGENEAFGGMSNPQYSSPLDNGAQQLSFAGAYDLYSNTTASALLSMGQARRTDYLNQLASTDAVGEGVNTYSGNLQVMSRLTPDFELNFNYAHEQQSLSRFTDTGDNNYQNILANFDSGNSNRANLPKSFRKRTAQLAGQYSLPAHSAVKVGVDYETYNRINEEDSITTENSYWAEFKSQPHRSVGVSLTVEMSAREGEGYAYNRSMYRNLSPKQQLLRKYDLASRDRNATGLAINLSPLDSLNIGFAFDASNNAYSNSQVGFTDSKETSYTFDANYMISKFIAVSGFYSTELINANQSNDQLTRSAADSFSANEDQIDTAGIGLDYHVIANKFDVGFDFVRAQASGKINLNSESALSDLKASSDTLHLYSKYKYSNVLHFQVAYRYAKYADANTASDNTTPVNSVDDSTATSFNPQYNIGEFALSMRYRF